MRHLQRIRGLTLVEMIVGLAVGAIVLAAFMMQQSSFNKATQSFDGSVEFDGLKVSIQQIVKKSELCKIAFYGAASTTATFNPLDSPMSNISQIKLSGTTLAVTNQSLGSGLVVSKIALEDTGAAPLIDASSGTDTYFAKLIVEASRISGGVGLAKLSNAETPFYLTLVVDNSTNFIQNCHNGNGVTNAITAAQMCTVLGGAYAITTYPNCVLP